MANLIAIRLYGSTSETAVTLVDEATLPRVISGIAAGDYEIGRTRIRWSGQKTTVYGPPPTPELLPLAFTAVDARTQGTKVLTFTRPWADTPGAITIVSQIPANAFQMNADGVTLEYGSVALDALQTQIATATLRYSDASGGPYDFTVSATVRASVSPIGGPFALTFDVKPDLTNPVVTLATAIVTATTVNVPLSLSEGTGTLYYVNDPAASLTAEEVMAHASVQTRAIAAPGAQADIALTGLTAGTTGRVHAAHKDQAGNISTAPSVSYTTTAAPAGLTGVDAPVTIINSTANVAAYSGTVDVVAGQKLIVHAYAWTGAGGQNPTTEWAATFDGAPITPVSQTFNAGMNMAGAAYEIDIAASGTKTLAITLGAAGRGLFAHGWKLEGFGTPAVQSSGNNSVYAADVTSLTVPTAFTPAQDGNAILASVMIRGAGQAASVTVAGADGYLAADTGANAMSDFTAVRAWKVVDPAAATTFTFNWTTAARACGLRTEIKKGP